MRLFAYKVVYDIGFAPNPFHGVCTLATCKPGVRAAATVGDWVVGVGSQAQGSLGKLVYGMQVAEKLTFDEYWEDQRFAKKRPDRAGSLKYRYGDNVYHRDAKGTWIQADCRHSLESGAAHPDHVKRDTGANAVLIAGAFTYWGSEGPGIPAELRDPDRADLADPGRGFAYRTYSDDFVAATVDWLLSLPTGYQGTPADWKQ